MTLEQLADSMKGAHDMVGELGVELLQALTDATFEEVKGLAHQARDTGELEESVVKGKNRVGMKAPHAAIIDRGRKRGFTPRGQKRIRPSRAKGKKPKTNPKAPMYGSKKVPRGITKPAKKVVLANADKILKPVLDRFEDKLLPGGGS
jgi:hypothetical protein